MGSSRIPHGAATALVLGLILGGQGCGGDSTEPQATPDIRTSVVIKDSVPFGDTVVAVIRVTNQGAASASFRYSSIDFLAGELDDAYGDCLLGCIPMWVSRYVDLIIAPGESVTREFRWGPPEGGALAPGPYQVQGGIRQYSDRYPWARANLVIAERAHE